MTKAIFFDFDDTLGNRELAAYNLYKDLLKPYFSDDLLLQSAIQDILVFEQYGNCNKRQVQKQFEKRYNVKLQFDLPVIWEEYIAKYSLPFDDTIETLEYLKKKYKLGVITNGLTSTQHGKIEQSGIKDYFDVIVTSEEVNCNKPGKQIFVYAADKIGEDIKDCVYVGDVFSNDVYGALNAGMQAVWHWRRGFRKFEADVVRIDCLKQLIDLY